eukprot:scaffold86769_cov50-Phaeocystis_antarctica.AAC.2
MSPNLSPSPNPCPNPNSSPSPNPTPTPNPNPNPTPNQARRTSHAYLMQQLEQEPWISATLHPPQSDESGLVRERLFGDGWRPVIGECRALERHLHYPRRGRLVAFLYASKALSGYTDGSLFRGASPVTCHNDVVGGACTSRPVQAPPTTSLYVVARGTPSTLQGASAPLS